MAFVIGELLATKVQEDKKLHHEFVRGWPFNSQLIVDITQLNVA